ncbi:MAG: flagellar export chaperone FliS [Gemmatimonadetes bacterium]|jgi:flagellar secretion chaperone FliS|nr:flagellar export chaperone FliS [Gemmatimonadota bacterium]MBT6145490.1 flagellar export chaperone FliS [Gemmatimonadota bacterium]MBT7859931.1 flagellar export chaperone FliS [Gemmatimonadota bacterium]
MNRSPGHRQYNAVQIKTANKGQLIVLLYQGALRNMRKALLQLEGKDMEGKGNSLIKAQDIILELMCALDQSMLNEGNELAANLQRLYLYCYRQLVQANLKMTPKPIEEVIELLANLLEAWEQVAANGGTDGGGSPQPTVALTG